MFLQNNNVLFMIQKKMGQSMTATTFGYFDANGDGELDQDEMKALAALL